MRAPLLVGLLVVLLAGCTAARVASSPPTRPSASDASRSALARAVLADARGDAAERDGALAWLRRLDPGPLARLAEARVRGDAEALRWAAPARPELWPEAVAAAGPHRDEVARAWLDAEVPPWQLADRAAEALRLGRPVEAARDARAALAWVPRADVLATWIAAAEASCTLDAVRAWAAATPTPQGSAWDAARRRLATATCRGIAVPRPPG